MTDTADRSFASARWDEFLDFVNRHSRADWMFRGVSDTRHLLVPKIGRPFLLDRYSPARERAIFKTFKRRAGLYADRMPQGDLEWLALAQHHGLPTRLLDWSSNPMVAAYFAVSGDNSAVARIYAVTVSRLPKIDPVDDAKIDPFEEIEEVSFLVPSAHVRRIAHQRGFFTIHPQPDQPWNPYGLRRAVRHHQFDIEPDLRPFFQRRLFYLGITAAAIMDDLDGLARTLEWQYRSGVAVGQLSY